VLEFQTGPLLVIESLENCLDLEFLSLVSGVWCLVSEW